MQKDKEKNQYHAIFQHMKSGIVIVEAIDNGEDFICIDVQWTGVTIKNIPKNNVLNKRLTELFPKFDKLGLFRILHRVWKTGKPEIYPVNLSSDNHLSYLWKNYIYKLSSGQIVVVYIDVTGERQDQDDIRQLNKKLEEKVFESEEKINKMNQEFESFVYSVSHDLRAPLRHIINFIELYKENIYCNLDEKSNYYLNIISESAIHMRKLINDLLEFYRIVRCNMLYKQVNMNSIVKYVINNIKDQTVKRNIEWIIKDLPAVTGDKDMLYQVLVHFISNAVKFTQYKKQAKIEIGSMHENNQIIYYIRDNGAGFNMKYGNKLFTVFQRLHNVDKFEGTGIGLAIIKRIIDRHGGKVWARGKVNKGAAFYFSLPTNI